MQQIAASVVAKNAEKSKNQRMRLLALAFAVIGIALYQTGMQIARRDVALAGDLLMTARYTQVATYLVFILLFRNHLPSVRTLLVCAGGLLLISCAGSVLGILFPDLPFAAAVMIQVCSGIAIGITYLLFWHFLSTYEPHAGVTALFASQALRELLFGSSAIWSQDAIFWMQVWGRVAGLALFVGALALKATHPNERDHPMQYGFAPADVTSHRPFAFLTSSADFLFQALLAVLLTFIFGFTSMLVSDPGMQNGHHDLVSEACAVGCLVLILAGVWSSRLKMSFNFFFISTMGLYALGLMLMPSLWGDGSPFASALLRSGTAIYEAVLYALLIIKAHDNPRYAYLYFAAFGVFANVNYGRTLEPLLIHGPVDQIVLFKVCSFFLFLMVAMCLLLLFLQRTRFAGTSGGSQGELTSAATATIDPFAANIELLCERYRLTAREREVLLEVLHGFTAPNVARRLGIAPGTVRTHMKNVYHKTGAANKQELIRLIDGMGLDGSDERRERAIS